MGRPLRANSVRFANGFPENSAVWYGLPDSIHLGTGRMTWEQSQTAFDAML
jgi:hypothetical protein